MSIQKANAHWVVWITLLAAALLSIAPLPEWVSVGRPCFCSSGHDVLDSNAAGTFWAPFCLCDRSASGCFPWDCLWPQYHGSASGGICYCWPASQVAYVSNVAASLYGVCYHWLLSIADSLGSQCHWADGSIAMVPVTFRDQCADLAMAGVYITFFTSLLPGYLTDYDLSSLSVSKKSRITAADWSAIS